MRPKLLIAQFAALGPEQAPSGFRRMKSVFPAVTCTVQASVRTGLPASGHGMVANGLWFADLHKVLFWEQSAALVEGERIWDAARGTSDGRRVGMMFWQQSLGESVDLLVSPAPIHKHGGGMIQDVLTEPRELQSRLTQAVGRAFNLMHYWGPLASGKSSEWIVAATEHVMRSDDAPEVLFTYVPHLDYALQRHGPASEAAGESVAAVAGHIQELRRAAAESGYETVFYGDYAIGEATLGAAFPNRALAEAGLFSTRIIKGMSYPDFHGSRAFAVVDHAVAHVFVRESRDMERARAALDSLPGVESVMDRATQKDVGIAHRRSGDLVLIAKAGAWFAYPWWPEDQRAPDFATHVDIHNKPGFDPCELFFGWPPLSVSQDTRRVKGTHGRVSDVAWDASIDLGAPQDHAELGRALRDWIASR